MKVIEDDTMKWKDTPYSWAGRRNTVKMSILPKAIYTFNAILIKIPTAFFHRARTNNPKILMELQKNQIAKATLKKKSKTGDITIQDF